MLYLKVLTEGLVASLRADVLTALLAYWLVCCCTDAVLQ